MGIARVHHIYLKITPCVCVVFDLPTRGGLSRFSVSVYVSFRIE